MQVAPSSILTYYHTCEYFSKIPLSRYYFINLKRSRNLFFWGFTRMFKWFWRNYWWQCWIVRADNCCSINCDRRTRLHRSTIIFYSLFWTSWNFRFLYFLNIEKLFLYIRNFLFNWWSELDFLDPFEIWIFYSVFGLRCVL